MIIHIYIFFFSTSSQVLSNSSFFFLFCITITHFLLLLILFILLVFYFNFSTSQFPLCLDHSVTSLCAYSILHINLPRHIAPFPPLGAWASTVFKSSTPRLAAWKESTDSLFTVYSWAPSLFTSPRLELVQSRLRMNDRSLLHVNHSAPLCVCVSKSVF